MCLGECAEFHMQPWPWGWPCIIDSMIPPTLSAAEGCPCSTGRPGAWLVGSSPIPREIGSDQGSYRALVALQCLAGRLGVFVSGSSSPQVDYSAM